MWRTALNAFVVIGTAAGGMFAADDSPAVIAGKVKQLQSTVLGISSETPTLLRAMFITLAGQGPAAKAVLKSLATREDISETHRVFAGGLLANYDAFNPAALKALLAHPNVAVRIGAVTHLSDIGGAEHRRTIVDAGDRDPELKRMKTFAEAVRHMSVTPRLDMTTLANLDTMVNTTDPKIVGAASASVVLLHEVQPKMAELAFRKLLSLHVTPSGSAYLAGRALANFNRGEVATLAEFTDRQNHKWLRFHAIKPLSQTEEGKRVLRRLLANETEPLRPQIQEALTK